MENIAQTQSGQTVNDIYNKNTLPFSDVFLINLLPKTGMGDESSFGLVIRSHAQKFTYTGVQLDD